MENSLRWQDHVTIDAQIPHGKRVFAELVSRYRNLSQSDRRAVARRDRAELPVSHTRGNPGGTRVRGEVATGTSRRVTDLSVSPDRSAYVV